MMYFKAKAYNDLFSELTVSIMVFAILIYYIGMCISNINELYNVFNKKYLFLYK